MPQRNVTITKHQNAFVEAVLASGQYGNVSEVFRTALRLLEREEQGRVMEQETIQRSIARGVKDIETGRYTEVSNPDELTQFFAGIRAERNPPSGE